MRNNSLKRFGQSHHLSISFLLLGEANRGKDPEKEDTKEGALKEVLYPGNSGYYAQTGGNLANLRYNTTIDKVTFIEICTWLLFKAQIKSPILRPR